MTVTRPERAALATRHTMTTASALNAALDTGLVVALSGEPTSVEELARRTGTHTRGLRLLLDALTVAGLVEAEADGYRWCDWPDSSQLVQLRRGMTQLLATGAVDVTVEETSAAQQSYGPVVGRLASYSSRAASMVAGELEPGDLVLDVAAGAAPFGLAAASAGATVALLDLPFVVDVGAELARTQGLAVEAIAADVFDRSIDARLGRSFDAVIIGGFCRLFAGHEIETLLARVAAWLLPGGRVFVVDAIDSFDARRRGIALYALHLATRTNQGGIHSFAHYAQWLERAGFEQLELTATDLVEVSIISARVADSRGVTT